MADSVPVPDLEATAFDKLRRRMEEERDQNDLQMLTTWKAAVVATEAVAEAVAERDTHHAELIEAARAEVRDARKPGRTQRLDRLAAALTALGTPEEKT